MLRSAFRGKQPSDSSGKDENHGKSAHGKSHFFFHRDAEGRAGDANTNDHENLNALTEESVGYGTVDGELTVDFNHEFLESAQSSSSDKESVNGEESMSKSLLAENGAKPDHDQKVNKAKRDSFSSSERQIYEMQLAQLQEQLVNIMIDNQEMSKFYNKLYHLTTFRIPGGGQPDNTDPRSVPRNTPTDPLSGPQTPQNRIKIINIII